VLSDEPWMRAEPWAIRFVLRYDGEELTDGFTIKNDKWKKGGKMLI
jgi:hypothetical protein